jgi:hypothetical protein
MILVPLLPWSLLLEDNGALTVQNGAGASQGLHLQILAVTILAQHFSDCVQRRAVTSFEFNSVVRFDWFSGA